MSSPTENGNGYYGDNPTKEMEGEDKKADELEPEPEPPSFETVLEMLGMPGRYQSTQLLMTYLSKFIVTFMALSYVFIGYYPPHICNAVNETSLVIDSYLDLSNYTNMVTVRYDDECKIAVTTANDTDNYGVKHDVIYSSNCLNGRNFYTTNGASTTYISEWDLVCESTGIAEWSQTIFIIGQVIGGLITSQITDRIGRNPVFVACTSSVLVLEALVLIAPSIYVIYAIKLFSGFCFQGVMTSYFVTGMELLLPRHRQIYGVSICYLWVCQLMLMGGLAYLLQDHSWRILQGIIVASGSFCVLFPFFFNESPRWLAANNKRDKALAIIKQACKQNKKDFAKVRVVFDEFMSAQNRNLNLSDNLRLVPAANTNTNTKEDESTACYPEGGNNSPSSVSETEEDIISSSFASREEKQSILTLFRSKELLPVTLIALYTWVTCNMTYYGLYMTSSSIAGDRFLNYILMALVEIPSNTIILIMLNKLTRRFVLMFFLALSGTSLMTFSIFVSVVEGYDYISTTLFIFGKFSITCAFNTIFIYTPEIFPTNLRGVGTGFCNSFGRSGSMIAPFLRPLYNVAPWAPGLIFTVMCAIAFCLVPFLPEMKDKNLANNLEDFETTEREKKKKDKKSVI